MKPGSVSLSGDYKNSEPRQRVAVGVPVMGGRRTTFPRSPAVSSSRRGLTSLFGMGRGAPPRHSRHLLVHRPFRMGESGHTAIRTLERKRSGH